jgi:hypothetical protein
MDLFNIMVWLFAGVVINWLTSEMVKVERRRAHKPVPVKDRDTKKS